MNFRLTGGLISVLLIVTFWGSNWAFSNPITFYVTDFGINQWDTNLKLGADFRNAANAVFPELTRPAQILVPMPADPQWNMFSQTELTQHFADAIQAKVDAGLSQGLDTFEIQLVQNINSKGYADPFRQNKVNQFGAAAYTALGQVIDHVEAQGNRVGTYAIVGSNGTKVLTENVASWQRHGKAYLHGVDFFDGRAFTTPTIATIEAVGADKVRFFNTKGDYPAPYTPVGMKSIGSYDSVRDIKDRFPNVTSYLLTPQTKKLAIGYGHVAGMRSSHAEFQVREYRGREGTYDLMQPVKGKDLRPLTGRIERQHAPLSQDQFIRTNPHRYSAGFEERIQVSRTSVENLSAGVFAYANALKGAHEKALKQLPFLRDHGLSARESKLLKSGQYFKQAYDLSQAIEQDLRASTMGKHAWLRSQTLEAVGKVGLDLIGSLQLADNPKFSNWTVDHVARIGAYQDLVTGVAKHIGRGKTDLDVVEHYINGVKELAKVSLAAKDALKPKFLFLDGIQDLAMAGAHHIQSRRLDIDTATKYVDAVNNLAWTGLGVAACGGGAGCTAAIQQFGVTAAKIGRDSTESLFKKGVLAVRGQDRKVVAQWLTLQQKRIQLGLSPQTISEAYGNEILKENGLSDTQIQKLDMAVLDVQANIAQSLDNRTTSSATLRMTPATMASSPISDRGGVDLGGSEPAFRAEKLASEKAGVKEAGEANTGALFYDYSPK